MSSSTKKRRSQHWIFDKFQIARTLRFYCHMIRDREWQEIWFRLKSDTWGKVRIFEYWLQTPSNRLTIRNIPRSWTDRNDRFFHACFSIMCDFVEKEFASHEGGFAAYAAWCEAEWLKNDPTKPHEYMPRHQYETAVTLRDLHQWYTSVNWDDPVPYNGPWGDYDFVEVPGSNGEFHEMVDNTPSEIRVKLNDHSQREKEFKELCELQLERLFRVYRGMWT